MAKIKIGFDIGSSSMKVAVAKGGSFRVETVHLPNHLMNEEGVAIPHALSQFLKQTVKELRLPTGPAALSLPSGLAICRMATLPVMTKEQLDLNLPYEFADFIQGSPEQYFCDYAMCEPNEGDEEGTMSMVAAAIAKQRVREYLQMFGNAGIRLKKLVPPEMALIDLCRFFGEENGAKEFFFVDLGHVQTRITIVAGDRVQATRTLQLGGRDMDMAIAKELEIDDVLAGTYKLSGNKSALGVSALMDISQRLAMEIVKVVKFYQYTYRANTLEGLYLVGGGAAFEVLRHAIETALDESQVELKILDPAKLLWTTAGGAADGVFAAGAAL